MDNQPLDPASMPADALAAPPDDTDTAPVETAASSAAFDAANEDTDRLGEVIMPDFSQPEAEVEVLPPPAPTMGQRLGKVYDAICTFFKEQPMLTRFFGLYLLFSGILIFISYNETPPTKAIDAWQGYIRNMNFKLLVSGVAGGFVLLTLLKNHWKKIAFDSYVLVAGLLCFGTAVLWRSDNFFLCIGMIVLLVLLGVSLIKNADFEALRRIPKWATILLIFLLAGSMASFIGVLTVLQHKHYSTSCFDFGIFVQMFHSMTTDLTAVTTCERDKFLSHFAVHFSPIYYLLVPFYYFFPHPETLLIAQGIIVMSGVIPLYLICRKYKFGNVSCIAMSAVYCFSAALISPCFYDFHENAFLPALLLWFFYAMETKKYPLAGVFLLLNLFVKEDVPLYMMCIGLYYLFSKRRKMAGFITFAGSVVYFIVVTALINRYGEGVMISRFGNFMVNPTDGFKDVILNVLRNPAYFFSQCFAEDNLVFILQMLLPLLFIPLITKKGARLFLIVPLALMNLATDYFYASQIGYQYVFGTGTCLIFLVVINTADMPKRMRHTVLPLMAAASLLTAVSLDSNKLYHYDAYDNGKARFQTLDKLLSVVPDDASVSVNTWYLPHVANRAELYMLEESDADKPDFCDFVILSDSSGEAWVQTKTDLLMAEGYTYFAGQKGLLSIYVSPRYIQKMLTQAK